MALLNIGKKKDSGESKPEQKEGEKPAEKKEDVPSELPALPEKKEEKPAEAKPAEAKPAEAKPAEAKPAEQAAQAAAPAAEAKPEAPKKELAPDELPPKEAKPAAPAPAAEAKPAEHAAQPAPAAPAKPAFTLTKEGAQVLEEGLFFSKLVSKFQDSDDKSKLKEDLDHVTLFENIKKSWEVSEFDRELKRINDIVIEKLKPMQQLEKEWGLLKKEVTEQQNILREKEKLIQQNVDDIKQLLNESSKIKKLLEKKKSKK